MMRTRFLLARASLTLAALCAVALAARMMSSAIAADEAPAAPVAAAPAPAAPAGWKPVWSDEFEGTAIDPKKWDFDLGNRLPTGQPGWGNDELQYYTARGENAYAANGMLHIRAAREVHEGQPYTSARMKTRGRFAATYGRFEIRAKLPKGRGVWPAIWMLPEENRYGGWAASGEIDIMEARGQEPGKVLGTLHYGSGWPANAHSGKDYVFPDGGSFADFHVYALEWDPGEIRWYVDGELYQTQNFWWSASLRDGGGNGAAPKSEADLNPWPAPFDQPFHLVLNVAVGGRFLGNPDADTPFPAEMVVDYVRAYERAAGRPPTRPRAPGKLPFDRP
jgi:beta-glucanase (GH16 family)